MTREEQIAQAKQRAIGYAESVGYGAALSSLFGDLGKPPLSLSQRMQSGLLLLAMGSCNLNDPAQLRLWIEELKI